MSAPAGAVAVIACVNVDVLVREVDRLPPPGTDNTVDEIAVRAAGPAMNAAFVLHALGDGAARPFGAVGDDGLGRLVLDECRVRDVPTGDIAVVAGRRTGVSVALESAARPRAFLTDLGAAAQFDDTMIPTSFAGFTDVLIGGYFVAPALRGEPTRRALRRAREAGARTWLDCGWDTESWTEASRAEVLDLLGDVDVFVPNHDEVAALTGTDDPASGGRKLAELTRAGVIVKAGADGAYWVPSPGDLAADESRWAGTGIAQGDVIHIPAPVVDVIDTTGAGDALNAGVIVGLRRGLAMPDAVTLGVAAASAIVARPSARRWDPLDL